MSNKTKKYFTFVIGKLIFSLGITLGNKSLFGGNSMAILVVGISKHLPLSYGTCNLIVAIIEMLVGLYFEKKNVTWVSWLAMVFGSYLIDFTNILIPSTSVISARVMYMLIGTICYCMGLALEQTANIGYSNLDVFIFGLKKALKQDTYHSTKWIVDICFIAIGLLLGSAVGIGTVILLAFAGILIERFKKIFEKLLGTQND